MMARLAALGYPQAWGRLMVGLGGLPFAVPAASAMTQARRRLGPGPLRALFFPQSGPSPNAADGPDRDGNRLPRIARAAITHAVAEKLTRRIASSPHGCP
jgi:Insertion element 4 transposase N-terminal